MNTKWHAICGRTCGRPRVPCMSYARTDARTSNTRAKFRSRPKWLLSHNSIKHSWQVHFSEGQRSKPAGSGIVLGVDKVKAHVPALLLEPSRGSVESAVCWVPERIRAR